MPPARLQPLGVSALARARVLAPESIKLPYVQMGPIKLPRIHWRWSRLDALRWLGNRGRARSSLRCWPVYDSRRRQSRHRRQTVNLTSYYTGDPTARGKIVVSSWDRTSRQGREQRQRRGYRYFANFLRRTFETLRALISGPSACVSKPTLWETRSLTLVALRRCLRIALS